MRPNLPTADVQHLQVLAEGYLDVPRACFLCRDWPASMALVYLADNGTRGCVFGVCAVCLASDPDDFQARVGAALRKVRPQEMAAWN